MKYAIIDQSGNVINSVELEEGVEWSPPDGCTMEQSDIAGIGWKYSDGQFVAPPTPLIPEISAGQQILILEQSNLLPRCLRDMILKDPTNPAYAKTKAIDDQITALRASLVKGV